MDVRSYVAAVSAEPFAWGRNSCALIADRWVQIVKGFSPMKRFGRVYANREEALEWLAEPGDLTVAFNRVMRANGFKRTKEPKPGDLGLVIFDKRMCIAIHAGDCWFSRHEDGLIAAPLDNFWKAWSV